MEFVKEENRETEAMLFTEENKKNVEELKELNLISLTELLPLKDNREAASVFNNDLESTANADAFCAEESKKGNREIATDGVGLTQQTKIDYVA